jgi:hypothetical protein
MTTLKDLAKKNLDDFERKKKGLISKQEIYDMIVKNTKVGKKKITKYNIKVDEDTAKWVVEEGIHLVKEYIPKNFFKRIFQKIFRIKCIRFDWDDEIEQKQKKQEQELELLKKKIAELTIKLSDNKSNENKDK